jgi:hypothetical protein
VFGVFGGCLRISSFADVRYLVFPSQFNRDHEDLREPKGKAAAIVFKDVAGSTALGDEIISGRCVWRQRMSSAAR